MCPSLLGSVPNRQPGFVILSISCHHRSGLAPYSLRTLRTLLCMYQTSTIQTSVDPLFYFFYSWPPVSLFVNYLSPSFLFFLSTCSPFPICELPRTAQLSATSVISVRHITVRQHAKKSGTTIHYLQPIQRTLQGICAAMITGVEDPCL